ncbi:hypothetical protein BJX99DRAFT_272570 [Aspergillus californicus]
MACSGRDRHIEQDIHVARTKCLLCRQLSRAQTPILDLDLKLFELPRTRYSMPALWDDPFLATWFHPDCYAILARTYATSNKSRSDELMIFQTLLKELYPRESNNGDDASAGRAFKQELFERLPTEIQFIIADFMDPLSYLIVLGESRRLFEELRNTTIKQRERIGLTNRIYILRVINTPFELPKSSSQQCMEIPSETDRIVLSVDHIGVRRLQILNPTAAPVTDGSPWYETIQIPHSGVELYVRCDGLFVRSMGTGEKPAAEKDMTWKIPNAPHLQQWNVHSFRASRRLDYIKLDAEVKGLLVCCHSHGTIGMHRFKGMSKEFERFVTAINYRTPNPRKYWMYFPINAEETFEGVWVRQLSGSTGEGADPFLTGDGVVSGIVHDGWDVGRKRISTFGITCDLQSPVDAADREPPFSQYKLPKIPSRGGSLVNTWFMTKALLNGLHKVQVCRDQQQTHHPCLGLLLYYDDRHVESVGQIQWDQQVMPDILAPIHIQHDSLDGRNYVKNIATYETEKI